MPFLSSSSFGVATVLATLATAVDISLYAGSVTCSPPALVCSNIASNTCCNNGIENDFFSAKFNGLATAGVPDFVSRHRPPGTFCFISLKLASGANATFQGVVFEVGNTEQACGTSCNSGTGANLCLDSGTCPALQGALWQAGSGRKKRGSAVPECVEPDKIVFGNGKSFRINHDVPANVTSQLLGLFFSDSHLSEGIPKDILPYELVD